jgi:hypothetical protein
MIAIETLVHNFCIAQSFSSALLSLLADMPLADSYVRKVLPAADESRPAHLANTGDRCRDTIPFWLLISD